MRPVDSVTYYMARGSEKGDRWPENNDVDEDSFMGKLRAKTGEAFDLPTEAQWEYACRATTGTALNNRHNLTNEITDGNLNKLGRYEYNKKDGKGGYTDAHTVVGSYLPNDWGLYDMHGNVSEWCADRLSFSSFPNPQTDPVGPNNNTRERISRGGSWDTSAQHCRSAKRSYARPNATNDYYGIRVSLPQ